MLDYSTASAPDENPTVWSAAALQPLGGGVLTPLSASVLVELVRRAWFAYFDRLGFAPAPMTRVARVHAGRVYLNLSISAGLDAEQAALTPVTLQVNGAPLPLAALEKPGLLGSLRVRGKRKQVAQLAATLWEEAPAMVGKAEAWCNRALEMRWTQAEVLQIMEEIERVGLEPMTAYLAARHNLERLYNGILHQLPGTTTARILCINNALSDLRDLVEVEMTQAVVEMSKHFATIPEAVAWFGSCELRHWQEDDPGEAVRTGLDEFMTRFGHRALNEGELANPRWYEEQDPILRAVHGCIKSDLGAPPKIPSAQAVRHLLDTVTGDAAQVERDLHLIRMWHKVQSRALHALAYIWTGTRRWALAAAAEAGADERVRNPQDIFFYELEEIKQMMTGEWNVSELEHIHALCAERKARQKSWQGEEPGLLLLDDVEAKPVSTATGGGVGAVTGRALGPLHHWRETRKNGGHDAIAAAHVLDSGWAVVLPVVHGAVSAGGSALDPFVSAARVWHRPTVVALGRHYTSLVEGAQTTVDGDEARVTQ